MFGDLFDLAVDVVTDSINTGARITDAILGTEINEEIEDLKDNIKNNDGN